MLDLQVVVSYTYLKQLFKDVQPNGLLLYENADREETDKSSGLVGKLLLKNNSKISLQCEMKKKP